MNKRKWFLNTLVFVFILSSLLVGCSSKGKEVEGNKQSVAPSAEAGDGKLKKYDPPIEMSTVTFNYNYPKFDKGDDINNNPWSRYMLEQYGIKVNTLWDVAESQYEQKVNIMIASREIPDFFAVTPMQFKQLYDAKLIEDLTDSYNMYASEDIKKLINDAGAEVLESAKMNGRIMAIPWTGEAQVGVPILWIREDWLTKLKLSGPQSMSDVLNIAKAFTTQDPDGNQKDDTYGLALDKNFDQLATGYADGYHVTGFLNGYHAYQGIWMKDSSGGLTYSTLQPEMKKALGVLQEMFKAKQIDPEFGVKDENKVNETIGANKLGMIFGTIGTAQVMQNLTPDTNWLPFPVPSIDGQKAALQHPLNIYSYYWVVKKGTKNPEAIYQMIQAWIDLYYKNTSDEVYAKYNAVTGTGYWMNAPIKLYNTFNDVDAYRHIKPFLENKDKTNEDLSKLTPMERAWYKELLEYEKGDMKFRGRNGKAGLNSGAKVIDGYVQNNQYMPEAFTTVPTSAMARKMPALKKMEYQMISRIILGAPLDEFDKFVEQWKKLGGDEITKEVNEWYKNR